LKLGRVNILLVGIFLAATVMNFGCGTSSPTATSVPITLNVSPSSAVILPGQTVQFSATENGASLSKPTWQVNKVTGGNSSVGTISSSGLYTAPANSGTTSVQITVADSARKLQSSPSTVSIFQQNNFQGGTVASTKNALVAQYTISAPQGAQVEVQFGTTTNYGLNTWTQPAPDLGGDVSIYVAGMRASSTYHIRGMMHLPNGDTLMDADQTFKTGAISGDLPRFAIQQTSGLEPAAGVEMLNLFEEVSKTQVTAIVTDLNGNIIWYDPIQPNEPFPMKLLPNGHILLISGGINAIGEATAGVIEEIDLAGNIIFELKQPDLQLGLSNAGFPITSESFVVPNHDIQELPNGHLIILASINKTLSGLGLVQGNVVIDWDPQSGPVWTWSTFDHISPSRAPFGTADLTHGNAVVYSPDDGNLVVSLRNQDWVIKINYQNGAGNGDILWRLGPGGDFTMTNGNAPLQWNYGQHYPVLLGPNTAGIFPIMFFDNGNNRLVDTSNDVCGTAGQPACYSSVPIFTLDENAKTANLVQENSLAPAYSVCCGSTNLISNGDLEFDVAADVNRQDVSYIKEMTRDSTPQLVWEMSITDQLAYRGFRIPSLYPGVTWTQAAIATAGAALPAKPVQVPPLKGAKTAGGFPYKP